MSYQAGFDAVMKTAGLGQRAYNATFGLPSLIYRTRASTDGGAAWGLIDQIENVLEVAARQGSGVAAYTHRRFPQAEAAIERLGQRISARDQALKDLAMGTAGLGTLGIAGAYAATRPKEAAFPVFDRIAPAFKALKGPPKPDLTSWKHVPENPIPGGFPGETRRTVAAQNAWKDLEDYGNNNNIEKRLREMYAILARGGASG